MRQSHCAQARRIVRRYAADQLRLETLLRHLMPRSVGQTASKVQKFPTNEGRQSLEVSSVRLRNSCADGQKELDEAQKKLGELKASDVCMA